MEHADTAADAFPPAGTLNNRRARSSIRCARQLSTGPHPQLQLSCWPENDCKQIHRFTRTMAQSLRFRQA